MEQSNRKGAFGDTLARYYHQSGSKTAVTSWPEQSTFAITRLHSEVGLPEVSQPIPEEAAIHVSIAIKPVPLRSYELYIDDRRIEVPFIPAYRTSIIDLESHPICTVDCGFDYVHYHVPREGLDEIARDHKIKPVGTYKFGICEDDLVIAQLTKNILPQVGSAEWTSPLALDQFSLIFGAHLLQTYSGLVRLPEITARGLAPWQLRRATELLCEHLDGGILLSRVARECGMSVSNFARSFKASLGVSAHRWLVLRRIERAKELMLTTQSPSATSRWRRVFRIRRHSTAASANSLGSARDAGAGNWPNGKPDPRCEALSRPAMSLVPFFANPLRLRRPFLSESAKTGTHPSE